MDSYGEHPEISHLKQVIAERDETLKELNVMYQELQESNNKRWQENKDLKEEVERLNGVIIQDSKLISELRTRLRNQGDKLEEDVKYWTEAYTCQSAQRSAEQEAFLRVIKVLAGRD
jgi:hypothetical protein